MQEGFVSVNNVPTRVVSRGGWIEDGLKGNKELILFISGNPGLTGYYSIFLDTIHSNLGIPVWALSHAGHELPPEERALPSLSKNPNFYNMEGQAQHKIAFMEKYIPPDVKVYLIGHSIGCKMILEVMKNSRIHSQVRKCYLMFPTIERMATSPNGKFLTSLILPIVPLIVFLAWVFTSLPRTLRRVLINIYFSIHKSTDDMIDTTVDLVNPTVLRNVFFLAKDEMENVTELDSDTMTTFRDKLVLYYGARDGWTPLDYVKDLKESHPEVKSIICDKNFDHAFVLNMSQAVGDMVSDWVKSERQK
uniref:Lipid droplet-associated hydrolase n=1 Tax=Timema douglasi TaxID=61478 RepID=A0A7R8VUD3_TIMDO|nr:unnamed protein product [Timema douglasi]